MGVDVTHEVKCVNRGRRKSGERERERLHTYAMRFEAWRDWELKCESSEVNINPATLLCLATFSKPNGAEFITLDREKRGAACMSETTKMIARAAEKDGTTEHEHSRPRRSSERARRGDILQMTFQIDFSAGNSAAELKREDAG